VDWSREGMRHVKRTCCSRHWVRGLISTDVGPRELQGLELQDLHLWWAGMSPEPVEPGARPPLLRSQFEFLPCEELLRRASHTGDLRGGLARRQIANACSLYDGLAHLPRQPGQDALHAVVGRGRGQGCLGGPFSVRHFWDLHARSDTLPHTLSHQKPGVKAASPWVVS
jgi:hypothetical protein